MTSLFSILKQLSIPYIYNEISDDTINKINVFFDFSTFNGKFSSFNEMWSEVIWQIYQQFQQFLNKNIKKKEKELFKEFLRNKHFEFPNSRASIPPLFFQLLDEVYSRQPNLVPKEKPKQKTVKNPQNPQAVENDETLAELSTYFGFKKGAEKEKKPKDSFFGDLSLEETLEEFAKFLKEFHGSVRLYFNGFSGWTNEIENLKRKKVFSSVSAKKKINSFDPSSAVTAGMADGDAITNDRFRASQVGTFSQLNKERLKKREKFNSLLFNSTPEEIFDLKQFMKHYSSDALHKNSNFNRFDEIFDISSENSEEFDKKLQEVLQNLKKHDDFSMNSHSIQAFLEYLIISLKIEKVLRVLFPNIQFFLNPPNEIGSSEDKILQFFVSEYEYAPKTANVVISEKENSLLQIISFVLPKREDCKNLFFQTTIFRKSNFLSAFSLREHVIDKVFKIEETAESLNWSTQEKETKEHEFALSFVFFGFLTGMSKSFFFKNLFPIVNDAEEEDQNPNTNEEQNAKNIQTIISLINPAAHSTKKQSDDALLAFQPENNKILINFNSLLQILNLPTKNNKKIEQTKSNLLEAVSKLQKRLKNLNTIQARLKKIQEFYENNPDLSKIMEIKKYQENGQQKLKINFNPEKTSTLFNYLAEVLLHLQKSCFSFFGKFEGNINSKFSEFLDNYHVHPEMIKDDLETRMEILKFLYQFLQILKEDICNFSGNNEKANLEIEKIQILGKEDLKIHFHLKNSIFLSLEHQILAKKEEQPSAFGDFPFPNVVLPIDQEILKEIHPFFMAKKDEEEKLSKNIINITSNASILQFTKTQEILSKILTNYGIVKPKFAEKAQILIQNSKKLELLDFSWLIFCLFSTNTPKNFKNLSKNSLKQQKNSQNVKETFDEEQDDENAWVTVKSKSGARNSKISKGAKRGNENENMTQDEELQNVEFEYQLWKTGMDMQMEGKQFDVRTPEKPSRRR